MLVIIEVDTTKLSTCQALGTTVVYTYRGGCIQLMTGDAIVLCKERLVQAYLKVNILFDLQAYQCIQHK